MSGYATNCLFVILPEMYNPEKGYEMSTIWPGLLGVYGTDSFCGHDLDLAIEYVNELNLARGHTPDFVTRALEITAGINRIHFFNA